MEVAHIKHQNDHGCVTHMPAPRTFPLPPTSKTRHEPLFGEHPKDCENEGCENEEEQCIFNRVSRRIHPSGCIRPLRSVKRKGTNEYYFEKQLSPCSRNDFQRCDLVAFQLKKVSKVNRAAGKVSNQLAGDDRLSVLFLARQRLARVLIP